MTPTEIKLRTKSRVLEVAFDDGSRFELPFEYLRVYSPSAEVRGHGPGQEQLQLERLRAERTELEQRMRRLQSSARDVSVEAVGERVNLLLTFEGGEVARFPLRSAASGQVARIRARSF